MIKNNVALFMDICSTGYAFLRVYGICWSFIILAIKKG